MRKGESPLKTQIVASFMPRQKQLSNEQRALIQQNAAYFDILELRIDALTECHTIVVEQLIDQILENYPTKPFEILVTYRTQSQGGEGHYERKDYFKLLRGLTQLKQIDLIDIEWVPDQQERGEIVSQIHQAGMVSIASYHNFEETPPIEVLKKTYYHMSQLGANHLKIAVMPRTTQDVLVLLQALSETSDALQQWVTGISMSQLGLISRTAQNTFGGALSYGALEKGVAPGQLHVKQLAEVLPLYSLFES
ncbi:type I 3-dehydroquinate dehydratase [Staphylococcus schleiferi]|uniref:3-dehydroquinate dehydratase n=1 Tax=Staphylococcus schleiferi TaxID=1295 RepID=A0A7Z7QRE2_STASC|nr:type I 3-dehydroquinate dehydratase [Staphylococcus schleiferi]CAD7360368.1 3-dehydroquinate dehydratase [Staphylococcus schleiferi]SUM89883.1 3-dehydroquinate dehydratase [Staphylococcus schleiferi]